MGYLTEKQIEYVGGEIKPIYIENAISWVLDNRDIMSKSDIPQLFGNMDGNPVQQVFVEVLSDLLKLK